MLFQEVNLFSLKPCLVSIILCLDTLCLDFLYEISHLIHCLVMTSPSTSRFRRQSKIVQCACNS